jgi:hypothetical protein
MIGRKPEMCCRTAGKSINSAYSGACGIKFIGRAGIFAVARNLGNTVGFAPVVRSMAWQRPSSYTAIIAHGNEW